jgi:hypothetical protein
VQRFSGPARQQLPRRLPLIIVVATFLAATVLAAPSASASTSADQGPSPLRVMITGDSISHEFAGDYTWRYRLHQEFERQRTPVDFVGPRSGATGVIPLTLTPFRDDQHDSLGGTRLAYQVGNISGDVTTYQPDVVLLMMGFNDLNHGAKADAVLGDMRQFLTNIWAAKPDTTVVLSHILDTVIYPGTSPRSIPIPEVNAGYDRLVQEFSAEHTVVIANEQARWVPRRHTVDGVHPTPTGEMTIAQRYATSLFGLGMLPGKPSLPLGYVPWATPARASAVQHAHGVVRFSWDYYKTRLTIYQGMLQVSGGPLRRPVVYYSGHFIGHYDHYLRPGRYTVRLAPIRKWLIGRWGPPVSFTVR